MFSQRNLPKNVQKYYRSLKILKEKWNIKRQYNLKFDKQLLPACVFTNDNSTNCAGVKIENKSFMSELRTSKISTFLDFSKLKLSKNNSFKDKILLSTAGIAAVNPEALNSTILSDPIPELPSIPEPPSIPTTEVVETVAGTGEPAFETLGLGGWSPVGIVQNCLEYLHISLDIPWWGAIVIGTICVRTLMFPLVIIAQRNGARMNNYLPQLQVLQLKMTEARQTGNQLDAARYGQEMMAFMKEKQLNPLKNMLVPLAQMPLFISFFIGLRQMANCPVQSMQEGGLFWFTDLTIPDQFFILPIITSVTMWATIEIGTDTAKLSAQNLQMMKYVLRAMPVIILPFTVNFPGAILCYWVCTNFISLGQVGVLRIPAVRDFFKIERLVTHNPENLPIKNKGFVSGMKDSWTNMKITSEIEGRKRYDEMQFQRAGKGPIVKTYKFDPTKQNAPAYSAKKR